MGHPFLDELYANKSRAFLYENVMGDREHFSKLSEVERTEITEQYRALRERMEESFTSKLLRSGYILGWGLSLFERLWIVLAVVVPILLLLRVEGAGVAAWLLPLVVLFYVGDNYQHGKASFASADEALFPTEATIVQGYLKEPLSHRVGEQRQQLLLGWKRYLVQNWAHQEPALEPEQFEKQVKVGEFFFNKARLHALMEMNGNTSSFDQKKSNWILLVYVLWNLIFAWGTKSKINRRAAENAEKSQRTFY